MFSILPFLAILGNDALKEEVRKFLPSLALMVGNTIFLCFFSIASVVITTIFRVITQIKVNLFIENTRVSVGQSLFENYLSKI